MTEVQLVERQRWYPIVGWASRLLRSDPVLPWSDGDGKACMKSDFPTATWELVPSPVESKDSSKAPPAVDGEFTNESISTDEGWEYAIDFRSPSFGACTATTVVRRRRWKGLIHPSVHIISNPVCHVPSNESEPVIAVATEVVAVPTKDGGQAVVETIATATAVETAGSTPQNTEADVDTTVAVTQAPASTTSTLSKAGSSFVSGRSIFGAARAAARSTAVAASAARGAANGVAQRAVGAASMARGAASAAMQAASEVSQFALSKSEERMMSVVTRESMLRPRMIPSAIHAVRDQRLSLQGQLQGEGDTNGSATTTVAISAGPFRNLTPYERHLVTICLPFLGPDNTFTDLEKAVQPKQQDSCQECGAAFIIRSAALHCASCGDSFCGAHCSDKKIVRKYGYKTPLAVCRHCKQALSDIEDMERIDWRVERVQDYFKQQLVPYYDDGVDTNFDKSVRIADGMLAAVKKIPLGGAAGMAISGVAAVRKYGPYGLAGVLLRQQLVDAGQVLKQLLDEVDYKYVKAEDMSLGLYYLMAIRRGLRGSNPKAELEEHKDCSLPSSTLLKSILYFAPLALAAAYEDTAFDIQRTAKHAGYSTLYVESRNSTYRPAFALFAKQESKECVLAIRGSKTIHDALTDIRANTKAYPGFTGVEQLHAHSGMAEAAMWLKEEVEYTLTAFEEKGYSITIVGHSLGT